jgi:hypothetical protein
MAVMEHEPLNMTSQSDIDEIESIFNSSVQPASLEVPPQSVPAVLKPSSPPTIPVSTPFLPSNFISSSHQTPAAKSTTGPAAPPAGFGGGSSYNTLTEPVSQTLKRDLMRVGHNLKDVVLPNPYRKDPGKALRDWDLWGPFFFIIFLALTLSYSATQNKSKVFAVVFATLSAGAIVLTLNVQLLGGSIIFLQSLSVLGYCLFPLDISAVVCQVNDTKVFRTLVVVFALAWSSWAAYPFVSTAVPASRKALSIYPVLLLYITVGFLVLAND